MNTEKAVAKREAALPEPVARRGITEAEWRTLANNLYPGANVNSVLMVVDYCKARKLDPLKKPCHIVPMKVKDAKTGNYEWRDVILPGIYEMRTTAMRTKLYMGHSEPEYGPAEEFYGVKAPSWCKMVIKRWNEIAKQVSEFPVMVHFAEVAATTKKDGVVQINDRWTKAPTQMLTKCTEAAGLREAFPDEFAGQMTMEEMEGKELDIPPEDPLVATLELYQDDIERIKTHIAMEEYKEAYGIWNAIPHEDQKILWRAPTKDPRAPFTTAERTIINSDAFKNAGRMIDYGIPSDPAELEAEDVP